MLKLFGPPVLGKGGFRETFRGGTPPRNYRILEYCITRCVALLGEIE